jgi:hypothetical protein
MPWAVAAAAVLALTLGPGPATRAGEEVSQRRTREGIKVHGDWTIELRNKDGSLASRHEFKNGLTPYGAGGLTRLLAGEEVPCSWFILTRSLDATFTGTCSSEGEIPCLSLSASGTEITLRGRLDPKPSSRVIANVSTQYFAREPDGGHCTGLPPSDAYEFTRRTLDTPITVQPEQSVDVKVVFSFSS